jgi:hypothetical protein
VCGICKNIEEKNIREAACHDDAPRKLDPSVDPSDLDCLCKKTKNNSGKDKKEKKPKKEKKGGAQKDGPAKKRGISGYNLYSKCIRQEVLDTHEGIKVGPVHVTAIFVRTG